MMRKGFKRAALLLLAAAVLLSGCGAQPAQKTAPLQVAISDDIVSLDPTATKDILSEAVARCVFSTLYTFDEKMELAPCLAKEGKRLTELEWEFTLRESAKFHDGSPLTAADVKFSLERAMAAEGGDNSLSVIGGMEAVDAHTLRVTTKEPVINLPALFVRVSTSVMSEAAVQKEGYDLLHPVGSGPFRVLEWEKGKAVRLERFDQYFFGPAKSAALNFVVEPSEQNSTSALLNGNIDVIFRVSAGDGDYLKLNEDVTIYETNSTKMELLQLNPDNAPLSDIRVRQAIACAIDKQTIVGNVLAGYGRPLSSMIPNPLSGAIDYDGYTYDPEKAAELLRDAGYPDGFDLTVLTFDEQRKKLMDYLKLDLAKVNINLSYEFLELSDYLEIIKKREHMGSIMSWTSNPDPDSTFTQLYSAAGSNTVNQSGYTDERVEALIREGRRLNDGAQRSALYREANGIVASSYYVIPLYQPSVLVAARSEVSGVRVNAQGMFGLEGLSREAS